MGSRGRYGAWVWRGEQELAYLAPAPFAACEEEQGASGAGPKESGKTKAEQC